jgi:hypothetical protein
MLDELHYEDYAKCLNTKFQAEAGEVGTIEMELITAEDKSPSADHEQFVLTFRAPVDAPVTQQIFNISHEQLGTGLVFLVPIAKDVSGVLYEAVFNRIRAKR